MARGCSFVNSSLLLSDFLLNMDPSIQNLKGKILEKPQKHRWSINKGDNKEEWKYTVEHEEEDWTPYNSNLQMQGIKVGLNIFI